MKKFLLWFKFIISVLCNVFNNHKDNEKPSN